jgi:hypothetical protein
MDVEVETSFNGKSGTRATSQIFKSRSITVLAKVNSHLGGCGQKIISHSAKGYTENRQAYQ